MAIIDLFKKKDSSKQAQKAVKKASKPSLKKKKEVKSLKKRLAIPKKRVPLLAPWVLRSFHMTEKAMDLAAQNVYIFKVAKASNKLQIKKAIEELYRVEVEDVRIINIHRKRRRFGKTMGWKKGYKKAIIKVAEGQKIDVI